jgi:broad specificity phosphatase PhoE
MDFTRLYLIRHGQVTNHHEFRYNGHFDVGITDTGVRQMERIAEFLFAECGGPPGNAIAAVYSSDLKRAVKGALIIGERLGLEPEKVTALRELHLGRWEGLTREEAAERFPDEAHISYKDFATSKVKGGESLLDLKKRVLPAVREITERHKGEAVCLVLHGGVNRVILCDAMGIKIENFFSIEQDYGCLNVIDHFPDGIKVVKLLNGGPNQALKRTVIY